MISRHSARVAGSAAISAVTTWLHRIVVNACLDRDPAAGGYLAGRWPGWTRRRSWTRLATTPMPGADEITSTGLDVMAALRTLGPDQQGGARAAGGHDGGLSGGRGRRRSSASRRARDQEPLCPRSRGQAAPPAGPHLRGGTSGADAPTSHSGAGAPTSHSGAGAPTSPHRSGAGRPGSGGAAASGGTIAPGVARIPRRHARAAPRYGTRRRPDASHLRREEVNPGYERTR